MANERIKIFTYATDEELEEMYNAFVGAEVKKVISYKNKDNKCTIRYTPKSGDDFFVPDVE